MNIILLIDTMSFIKKFVLKETKPTIYLFSGLGADERVFARLNLDKYDVIYIKWIEPLFEESLSDYAIRLSKQVTREYPILIGVSFGGIMAIEVSKIIAIRKLVIISSVKVSNELPYYVKLGKNFNIHKLIPSYFLKNTNKLVYLMFGITKQSDRLTLRSIIQDTDLLFMRRAIDKIVHWDNSSISSNIYHIHGTEDRLFPFKLINNAIPIDFGGHFMIWDKAKDIENILLQIID